MSTAVTNITAYMATEIEAELPEKKRLFNPYNVEINNELYLQDGYGIGYGAQSTVPVAGCCLRIQQDISLVLTKKFYALENDSEKRHDYEQELMEEAMQLVRLFEMDQALGGNASKCSYQGHNGIQQVFTESQQYIFVTMNFQTEFIENL